MSLRLARLGPDSSLQEYLRAVLVESAARPPGADIIARARARVVATGSHVDAAAILEARDADRC